eukprot:gb/GFBE01021536.1/.p1 GENE.gb/GFBE01021536.1/~~gb/GFBE01021536.1/.p1  ORF type:complete len:106 (+),score=26.65 gb/GFBE01021536.1/:1-318(+)
MSSSMSDKFKDYHRSLKQKRGEELSMKQVAYSFGGVYAVIHLLQYFDIWTLLLMMVIGYFAYRQIEQHWDVISAQFGQDTSEPPSSSSKSAGKPKGKKSQGPRSH